METYKDCKDDCTSDSDKDMDDEPYFTNCSEEFSATMIALGSKYVLSISAPKLENRAQTEKEKC